MFYNVIYDLWSLSFEFEMGNLIRIVTHLDLLFSYLLWCSKQCDFLFYILKMITAWLFEIFHWFWRWKELQNVFTRTGDNARIIVFIKIICFLHYSINIFWYYSLFLIRNLLDSFICDSVFSDLLSILDKTGEVW